MAALNGANSDPYAPVPASRLGAAVHPYSFQTGAQEPAYWTNWRQLGGNNTVCANLSYMITFWRGSLNSVNNNFNGVQIPLLMTEINYGSGASCQIPSYDLGREGSYQMDLFTWLYDHLGYGNAISYPVRTIWYANNDTANDPIRCPKQPGSPYLGLHFATNGGQKFWTSPWTDPNSSVQYSFRGCSI